jgi:hypothetical protein
MAGSELLHRISEALPSDMPNAEKIPPSGPMRPLHQNV